MIKKLMCRAYRLGWIEGFNCFTVQWYFLWFHIQHSSSFILDWLRFANLGRVNILISRDFFVIFSSWFKRSGGNNLYPLSPHYFPFSSWLKFMLKPQLFVLAESEFNKFKPRFKSPKNRFLFRAKNWNWKIGYNF